MTNAVPAAWKRILKNPTVYHYARHMATGGLPIRQWAELGGLFDSNERVADLGCGPADILRYVSPQRKPAFYLGLDLSDEYLDAARRRAAAAGCDAEFLSIDLTAIPTDNAVRDRIVALFEERGITRVLLYGVMHHIDDQSVATTLNMVHRARTVRAMTTQDVIRIPGHRINNRFCDMDRGEFIRDEAGYDRIIQSSDWPHHVKRWTSPGLAFIRYIHFQLSKQPLA